MQNKVKKLLSSVVLEVTPSSSEIKKVEETTRNVVSTLNKSLKSVRAKAMVAGSFKKNTQVKNTFEVDVFVLFDYKKYADKDDTLSDILERKLKKKFKRITRLHGSRDYFQIKIKPYTYEIVPILNIKSSSKAKNITDVSPLHARWVDRKAKKSVADIRLAKTFLSAARIYGAESYVKGFSGYSAEVLVIYYGSFLKFLKATKNWKDKQVIDPERVYKNKNPLMELNKSKIVSPLILIDPVQPSRNVTAALSTESFNILKTAAAKFLKNPSHSYFTKKIVTKQNLISGKPSKNWLLILELTPENNKIDVMGAAIVNKYELLRDNLLKQGFKVKKSSWEWDKQAFCWYLIDKKIPAEEEVRKGPKTADKANSLRFKQAHKKTFTKNNRLYAKVKRKFPTPKSLVTFLISQKNFKNKIERVKAEWH